MIVGSKTKKTLLAVSAAFLLSPFAFASSADARPWDRWGGGYGRHVVVHRTIVHRPVVRRVVYGHRPVVYRPYRRVVRRVVFVERPYYRRARYAYGYGYGYGWRHRVSYRPGWHYGGWRDRPRCWLPERHLCR